MNATKGETGMVLGTGKERPLSAGCEAGGYPEARFETASLHQITRLRIALIEVRGWVRHWQDDVACKLAPTKTSLAAAEAIVDAALAPRVRIVGKQYHNDRTTYTVNVDGTEYACTPREYDALLAGESAADLELQPAEEGEF